MKILSEVTGVNEVPLSLGIVSGDYPMLRCLNLHFLLETTRRLF